MQKYRRWVQSLSLLLLHSSWGPEFKWLCNPVLSCHSCALAWFACPVGIYIHYSGYHAFPFLAVGSVLLIGTLIGRLLCGWVCPFGFLQELLHKIPTRKFTLPPWTSYIKYVVLLLSVFLLPFFLGESTWWSFCRICPSSALQVTVPNLLLGGSFTFGTGLKLGVLAATLLLVVVAKRGFCKTLCPIGALLAPLNYLSFWRVKVPKDECLACRKCDKVCPTSVTPSERIEQRVPANRALDCVVCHQCQPTCPQQDHD
jgi:ferredoxin-type protein NapH